MGELRATIAERMSALRRAWRATRVRTCARCGSDAARRTCCGSAYLAICLECGFAERWEGGGVRRLPPGLAPPER